MTEKAITPPKFYAHEDTTIPWVEKYRPTTLNDIVLDTYNKRIFDNIVKTRKFPNLLFYGPPGTGKTTSIVNLISAYQHATLSSSKKKPNEDSDLEGKDHIESFMKHMVIHLNASDERGIDIIRNQINMFVYSHSLFYQGTKYVILDEIDYMTKNAQCALRSLLQTFKPNVRFCLICNYISRLDESLQGEFIKIRFNQLPEDNILNFLEHINKEERLKYSRKNLFLIKNMFQSDIRSMINYLQANQQISQNRKILKSEDWDNMTSHIVNEEVETSLQYIDAMSREHNIDKINIAKFYINHIIRNHKVSSLFLNHIEHLIHIQENNSNLLIQALVVKLKEFSFLFWE